MSDFAPAQWVYLAAPLASWAGFFVVAYRRLLAGPGETLCWRSGVLGASVLWGLVLVVMTEVLGLLHLLTRGWVFLGWVLCALAAFVIYWRLSRSQPTNDVRPRRLRLRAPDRLLVLGVIAIVAITGLTAWLASPNTHDSLTYHMSRVVHWSQNQSVAFYPTHIHRQLWLSPGAEYIILHLQLLTGGDRFANLVQWLASIGSAIGVSLVARELGARQRGQVIALVVAATVPMGILQASSTQNDYAVAFWLVCFVCFSLLCVRLPGKEYLALAGASLGLALVTKATAYVYAFPFLLVLCYLLWKKRDIRRLAYYSVSAVILVLVLNIGAFVRNFQQYSSILQPQFANQQLTNEVIGPKYILSGVVRNLGLHLSTRDKAANAFIARQINAVHDLLGVSISDPRTTFPKDDPVELPPAIDRFYNESRAGNIAHLALIVFSILALSYLAILRRIRLDEPIVLYALALILAFVAFSSYLKWQPWHSRLHLSLFVLFSPIIALVLSRYVYREISYSIAILLLCLSFPFVIRNESRPLIGEDNILAMDRTLHYFRGNSKEMATFLAMAESAKKWNCNDIGLIMGSDEREYLYWVAFDAIQGSGSRLRHVAVEDERSPRNAIAAESDAPCVVLSTKTSEEDIDVEGVAYTRIFSSDSTVGYVKLSLVQ